MWLYVTAWGRGEGSGPSDTTYLLFYFVFSFHFQLFFHLHPRSTDWLISEGLEVGSEQG